MRLILASTSRYRKDLLERLGLPFDTVSPDCDETPLDDEDPEQLVSRLALGKANSVASTRDSGLVIGSDQVAILDGDILGKAGSRANAVAQLERLSGREVSFLTGLCLANAMTGAKQTEVIPYTVTFRNLSGVEIERYVDAENPVDCAGSFKSEGLGVTLFECMKGSDPTALIGLPLIRLSAMLRAEGIALP